MVRFAHRSHFRNTLLLVLLCLPSVGCDRANPNSLEQQVSSLEAEVRSLKQMRSEIRTLQTDLAHVRARLKNPEVNNEPIRAAKWEPDGSHLDDPFLGVKGAPIVILGFGDFQCRPCKHFVENTLTQLKTEFTDSSKVQFIFRDFPMSNNEHAVAAASLAHCAGEQGKYWEMFARLYEYQDQVNRGDLNSIAEQISSIDLKKLLECAASNRYHREIAADISEGQRLGVRGIPAFFIGKQTPNGAYEGSFVRGAQPYAIFRSKVLKLLQHDSGFEQNGTGENGSG